MNKSFMPLQTSTETLVSWLNDQHAPVGYTINEGWDG
jgi:hypothetical protein